MRGLRGWIGAVGVGVGLALGAWPSAAQPSPGIERIVNEAARDYPSLAVAVIRDDAVVWSATLGGPDGSGAESDRRFNVYSVAKMLTGIAALRMVQAGDLDPDRSVLDLLPGLPSHLGAVTPRQLVAHLSGVGHYRDDVDWERYGALSCREPADALGHFVDRPLEAEPGERRIYTTYGYVLLSAVLGAAHRSGSYATAIRELVFDPAGMTDTRLDGPDASKVTPMAGSPEEGWRAIEVDASCKFGGGGFVSSAVDLARFGRALWDGSILDAEGVEQAMTPFRTRDGEITHYGWGMDTNTFEAEGERVLWGRHSGGSPGGRSFLVVLPDQRVAVALVANADGPSLRLPATSIAYLVAGVTPP